MYVNIYTCIMYVYMFHKAALHAPCRHTGACATVSRGATPTASDCRQRVPLADLRATGTESHPC